MNSPRHVSHDEVVIGMLKADPDFANEYLAVALEEADSPGGQTALLAALRHIAEAQGMSAVAARAGIPRESLYRALSPKGTRGPQAPALHLPERGSKEFRPSLTCWVFFGMGWWLHGTKPGTGGYAVATRAQNRKGLLLNY